MLKVVKVIYDIKSCITIFKTTFHLETILFYKLRHYQLYSLVHGLICMKSLCRKNSKNEVELVINNNHFHLYNTFEKIPRQLLTFKIIHSILNAKTSFKCDVEVTNLNTLRSANERVMVFIITLSHPQKNALFFFLKSLYLGVQLLLKISHLSKYLSKTKCKHWGTVAFHVLLFELQHKIDAI